MTRGMALALACWATVALAQVPASLGTEVISSAGLGDVAIAVSSDTPELSRIVGSDAPFNKLYVFGPDGGATQPPLMVGLVSGVAAHSGVVVASFSGSASAIYGLSDAGVLLPIGKRPILAGAGSVALWRTPSGQLEAWLDNGTTTLFRIVLVPDGTNPGVLDWQGLDGSVTFSRRPASLIVDDASRRLFAASSDGIWGWTIDGPIGPTLLEAVDGGELGGPPSDLALYPVGDGGLLLLAAVPQREDFIVYRVDGSALTALGRFQVTLGSRLVRSLQFLDLTTAPMPGFPRGVLVVSDRNSTTGSNYKYVAWPDVAEAFTPALPVPPEPGDAGGGEPLEDCVDEPTPDGGGDAGLALDAGDLDGSVSDAGLADSGLADAGSPDAGLQADAGRSDAGAPDGGRRPCRRDGGVSTRRDGGSGGGNIIEPEPPAGCCARGPSGILFPGALLGVWAMAFRRRTRR